MNLVCPILTIVCFHIVLQITPTRPLEHTNIVRTTTTTTNTGQPQTTNQQKQKQKYKI
eukprot:m.139842 g.139842  ORF g.139842 m.139842 type:complete len:58 (+) comp30085_c0_seq1:1354-1527(+)